MLTIRPEQMRALSQYMVEQFEVRAMAHLRAVVPDRVRDLDDAGLRQYVRRGMAVGQRYQIKTEADTLRFLVVLLTLGEGFATNHRTGWARQVLSRQDLQPRQKLDEIEARLAAAPSPVGLGTG